MLSNFHKWDNGSKAAAILCLANPLIYVATAFGGEPLEIAWWEWLLSALAFVALIPLVGAPQLVMLFLIRRARSSGLRIFFLICSVIMAGIFWYFLHTVELTGNSTAPLAAIFFPLYLGGGALLLGLFFLWLERMNAE
jgi:hypothetical protein